MYVFFDTQHIVEGIFMDRKERITRISDRLAFRMLAEGQPEEPLFGAAFSVVRQKARDYKEELELKARDSLQNSLIKDIKDRGYDNVSVEISLGKYRGSRFVISSKVRVLSKDIGHAKALVKFLQRYHPKYMLKHFDEDTKVAEYNIR
jgi:hypothetical protein